MRLRDVEFRWTENDGYQIVKWQEGGVCHFTIVAFFRNNLDYWSMEIVGHKFFDDHDAWIVGKHALRFLNDAYCGA